MNIESVRGFVDIKGSNAIVTGAISDLSFILKVSANFSHDCQPGSNTVFVHQHWTDSGYQTYGFMKEDERMMFRMLIAISGVGPGTAMSICSSMDFEEFAKVIGSQDLASLKKIKGLGAKTSERIILELKNKFDAIDAPVAIAVNKDAVEAIKALGYKATEAHEFVYRMAKDFPDLTTDAIIKQFLKTK
jgi:Holliday junction DNA helicase RuvA